MDDSGVIHTVWSALLSLGVGGILMIVKRFADDLKNKVDLSAFEQLRDELKEWKDSQSDMHRENRERLDRIILRLTSRHSSGIDDSR